MKRSLRTSINPETHKDGVPSGDIITAKNSRMKPKALLIAIAAIVTLFAISCKKAGKTGLLVPKDAAAVIYFNTGSLSSKLSWDEVKQSEWFKEMRQEASNDPFAQKVMENPSVSGIDIDKGFCFFYAPRGRGAYVSFQGKIKDLALFEVMLKANRETDATPSKSGDLSVIELDGNSVLTWNKTTFVLIADAPASGFDGGPSQRFPQDSLVLIAKNTYNLKGNDLLDSDSKFADLISSKGDVQFWFSASSMTNNLGMGVMNMLKLSALTDGNVSTATLSFDNGKINFDGKQYYGKELSKVFDKYSSKGVDNSLTSRLPGGDVLVAGAYSYPFGAILDMVKLIGADGIANMFLGQKGITMEDIGKAFKGDLAFAVSDIQSRQDTVKYEGYDGKPSSYVSTKSEPSYVFGVSIDDQKSFDKLYSVFQEELSKVPSSVANVKAEKGWLIIGNTPEMSSSFLAGNNKPAYADKLNGHQLAVYFNAQKLFRILDLEIKDSVGLRILTESKSVWQDALLSSDYKSGTTSFHMEVNFVDKGTNGLKILNKYADKIAAIHKENRNRYMDVTVDSVAVEAPPKAFN